MKLLIYIYISLPHFTNSAVIGFIFVEVFFPINIHLTLIKSSDILRLVGRHDYLAVSFIVVVTSSLCSDLLFIFFNGFVIA